jgi:hypothetical protein
MFKNKMKYHSVKTDISGIKFDSKKEADRYWELKLLEKAKKIRDLKLQPKFILQEGFIDNQGRRHRPITYTADFSYIEGETTIVEDVKSPMTAKLQDYVNKKKMFIKANPHLVFREII